MVLDVLVVVVVVDIVPVASDAEVSRESRLEDEKHLTRDERLEKTSSTNIPIRL